MAIRQSRGITLGKGTPQRLEGQNGDITIRSSRKGLKLYVKESNKWHSVDLGINLRQIASTVRKLEDEVKKLSTKTNNTPVVDKILLRQSGGTSAVGIQNKSGNIAFRNSTDTADGKLQSVPFDIGTDNTAGKGWGQFYYDSSSSSHYLESNGLLIVTQLNAPDATEQASVFMMSKEADSIVRFNERVSSKFIMGYDHLKADGSTSDARFKIHTGGSFADDSVFNLDANGTYIMGNVGIGTTSPTEALDVTGNIHCSGSLTADSLVTASLISHEGDTNTLIAFGTDTVTIKAGNEAFITIVEDGTQDNIQIGDGGDIDINLNTQLFVEGSSGNVGIGTTSPTTTLDVEGTVSYKHTTITASSDAINVSATTVLECDTSGGHIRVGGFAGGVQGQIVHVLKSTADSFRVIVEHDETPAAGASQRIFTSGASDITITARGGVTCYCTGSEWIVLNK